MQVGQTLQYLQRVSARKRIGRSSSDSVGVLDRVEELQAQLEQLKFPESDQAARDWLNPLIVQMEELLRKDSSAQLGKMASELREIAADLGKGNLGKWNLIVTVAGQRPREFKDIANGSASYEQLTWLGFTSNATSENVF